MNITIYEIIVIIFSILNIYVIFRMMRILNNSVSYNKKIELLSYIIWAIMNSILRQIVDFPYVVLVSNIVIFLGLSFNYGSRIRTKIISVFVIILVTNMSEIVTAIFVQDSLSQIAIAEASTMHGFIYCRIIDLTTMVFFLGLENKRESARRTGWRWYLPAVLALIAICIETNLLGGILNPRLIVFNLLIFVYILVAFAYLRILDQLQIRKERMLMQQQMNYYRDRFDESRVSANIESHFAVMREFAEKNETDRLLAYVKNLANTRENKEKIVNTGNLTIDSILNMKFDKAKKMGIQIKHEIIPSDKDFDIDIDDIDVSTVLIGLLSNAIKSIRYHAIKNIYFHMKFEKGIFYVNVVHANTVLNEQVRKNEYVYDDPLAMRAIEMVAEKYLGGMECEIKDDKVSVSVLLFVKERDEK